MSVSIQQAASNTFAAWLATKMTGVTVGSRWPSPDKALPNKAITVVTAGPRRDIPLALKQLEKTNNGALNVDVIWQVAACTQPLQLDVWAHSDFERDDILARLDTFLHYGEGSLAGVTNADPVGHSVLLALGDGWQAYDTIADFYFSDPDIDDSSETVGRDIYRATYRGDANFMLAIQKTSVRQLQINLTMFLDGDIPLTPITYSVEP